MRIAIVHNQPSGGARRALHGFCEQLRLRHTLDVYSLSTADDVWLDDAEVANEVVRTHVRRRRPVRLGLYLNDLLKRRDLSDLDRAYTGIAHMIDAAYYDVALVDVCQFTLVPPVLGALKTPSVYYAHNGPARLEEGMWGTPRTAWARMRAAWHGPLENAYNRRLAEMQVAAARSATRIATNSRHTADRVRAAYGVAADVCPPGIHVPPLDDHAREGYVLSVGEIEPRKGFGFVVDALAHVDPSVRPPLRIVANRANPVERERLCARARDAGVDLEILIDPPASVLWSSYARARAFVYGAHHEALGLAPLEAMARATPVVAVAEGGVPETVIDGRTGILTPRVASEFGARLESLLRDAGRAGRLGDAGYRHVELNWSWPARAVAMERVLIEVAHMPRVAVQ